MADNTKQRRVLNLRLATNAERETASRIRMEKLEENNPLLNMHPLEIDSRHPFNPMSKDWISQVEKKLSKVYGDTYRYINIAPPVDTQVLRLEDDGVVEDKYNFTPAQPISTTLQDHTSLPKPEDLAMPNVMEP